MAARTLQVLASLLVAAAIVAVTIAVVSAKLGPNADDDHGGDRDRQEDSRGGHGRG
jgi:hypothetical protein